MTDIEQLRKEADDVEKALDALKNNVSLSESEKKNESEKLKSQVETTKKKIEKEIHSLENKTDDESKKKKEEAEALLTSFNETMSLYASILDSAETKPTEPEVQEEKWLLKSIWEWFSDKRASFKNKDNDDKAKTAWLLLAWGLATRWIFSLFSKEKREERRERRRQRREARRAAREERRREIDALPFWERPFGKILKWTLIWTAIVWGAYWLWKYLWLIWKWDKVDGKSSDEDKFNWYEDEIVNNPENKEKLDNYESFWENIDLLYWSIYERELEAWYEDELEMQKIAKEQSNWEKYYKWIVPYCLDNHFKSVDNILWQNSSMKEAMADWLNWMLNYIKGKWNDFLQMFVNTYLDKLPSWLPFKNVAWSLSDRIEQWKVRNKNAESEMQYFFRQSIRVQTYLFEKRDQLIPKIVKESASKYGISEEDIIWDDENLKKYVIDTPEYQNFINGPISSSVTILKNYKIFDSEITENKKEDVKELDKQRNKVLWCNEWEKDILQIINEKKVNGEILSQQEDEQLWKSCDWIIKDIDDNILEAVEESARNIYWDLLWTEDSHLREYLNKSWLDKVFQSYKQTILQKKLELQEWKLSNEDKIALAESINAMLALKKEAKLWSQTIEKDYDENGNIIYRIWWFLKWSMKNLNKSVNKLIHWEFLDWLNYLLSAWLWTWIVISWAWVICMMKTLWKQWFWLAKTWAKIAVLPVSLTIEWLTKIKPVRDAVDRINYPLKFWWKDWPKKLMNLLKNEKISLSKASDIAKRHTLDPFVSENTEVIWKDFFHIDDRSKSIKHMVFDKLVSESSNTAVWASYLQTIKSDDDLYETLVRNYDSSLEIRRAISETAPIDELKRVAEWSNLPEFIKGNARYKWKIDELDLEVKKIRAMAWDNPSSAARKQLDNISEFKRGLSEMEPKEIERTLELLSEFERESRTLWWAIDQFTILRKLNGKFLDTWIVDQSWNPIRKSIDDIIKNMDFSELRKCKWKIAWVSDAAIESLAKTFESIKKSQVLKFSDNIDEIAQVVKTLVKIFAKAT